MKPLLLFEKWFSEENESNNLRLPAACCLSTIGLDGYPNSRFVSLKEITNDSFIITGPLDSRKGKEIENCSNAALTFWWTSTERQIRIQGDVSKIPDSEAERYFKPRNRDSKIVSNVFDQGKEIQSIESLKERFEVGKKKILNNEVIRPKNWSGISIKPLRIEFMEFKESRLHERKLYQRVNNKWEITILQP